MIPLTIIFAIIAAIVLTLGFGFPVIFSYTNAAEGKKNAAAFMRISLPILAGIYVMIMAIASIHIVDQTEVGVVRTLGKITGTLDSGFNIVNPFLSKVTIYDTKVHTMTLDFASYTKDAQPIDASVEIQYELPKSEIHTVATSYGTYEALESKLGNVVEEKIKVVLARLSAMTLMETRSDLSHSAMMEVRILQETFPISFRSVIIKDVDFSDAFEASVEAKMTAEQSALRAEQVKKESIIQAERDREVAKITAEAAIAAAQGEAEAMMITKEALAAMPTAYIEQLYLEKWDGKLPQIVSEGSNLMLTPSFD